jgi:hypothetical protein
MPLIIMPFGYMWESKKLFIIVVTIIIILNGPTAHCSVLNTFEDS